MVTNIVPPAGSVMNAELYNQNKMDFKEGVLSEEELKEYEDLESTGHVLATVNVPEGSTLEEEFDRLKILNKKTTKGKSVEKPAFHMSINPGQLDKPMTETQMLAFVTELMTELGYGNSPYRVYRHNDIDREHFHVVSTRIGQDGRKIKDSFEQVRCNKITERLGHKYGFVLGNRQGEKKGVFLTDNLEDKEVVGQTKKGSEIEKKRPSSKGKKPSVHSFKRKSDVPVTEQFKTIHEDAMTWRFSTPEQYTMLLARRYRVKAEIYGDKLGFIGLDGRGESVTPLVNETEIGISNAMINLLRKCEEEDMKKYKRQKERIEEAARECAEKSSSWKEFKAKMNEQGIYTALSWSKENEVFGVTWIDRATKCIFKASETNVDLSWLKLVAKEKEWKITRDSVFEKKPKKPLTKHPVRRRIKEYSEPSALKKVLDSKGGTNQTKRSEADASKNEADKIIRNDEERTVKI